MRQVFSISIGLACHKIKALLLAHAEVSSSPKTTSASATIKSITSAMHWGP